MRVMNLEDAKIHLLDLVEAAATGEEVFISRSDALSVQLVPHIVKKRKRQFGSAKGVISMAPGFDEPLTDFKEYQ